MNRITSDLKTRGKLVSDGAWGTMLQDLGMQSGECPELWCVTHEAQVYSIARAYIDAGADMIESNSFGANRVKLHLFGLEDRAAELNEAAARISRRAAGDDHHVIASIGPTGKILMMGDISEEEAYAAFREQAAALERGGADACCIESFTALDEICIAIRAAKENTRLEVLATMTFDHTLSNEYRTMMGVSPSAMAEALCVAGADVIGANCGTGMKDMAAIVAELRKAAPGVPILVHANAGLPVVQQGHVHYPETPDVTARFAAGVLDAGADIIGGCCGTTPDHIRALAALVGRR